MMNKKYNIQDCHDWAKSRKGECLSKEYSPKHLIWTCKEGHTWKAKPYNIKKGTWCPYCRGRNKTILDMRRLAQLSGGQCLSKKYINAKADLRWRCGNGHTWNARPDNIKSGKWCPHCRMYLTEEKCRFIFEQLTGKKFPKTREILPYRWELDGYCESLRLSFEYHGKQHYRRIPYWQSEKQFQDLVKRDQLKTARTQK